MSSAADGHRSEREPWEERAMGALSDLLPENDYLAGVAMLPLLPAAYALGMVIHVRHLWRKHHGR